MTTRLAAIQAGLAAGQSLRAIARELGVSDKTVRTTLASNNERARYLEEPAAEYADFIPPGPGRVLPTPTREQALFEGGVSHPGKAWIRCTCGAPAWRNAPGIDAWTCSAPVGPRGPHPPIQVADPDGVPQLRWGPHVIRPFPASLP